MKSAEEVLKDLVTHVHKVQGIGRCADCSYYPGDACILDMAKDAADVIKALQAEIKELRTAPGEEYAASATSSRDAIITKANSIAEGSREGMYGKPENNFEDIGLAWGVYLRAAHPELKKLVGVNFIQPKDMATMMAIMKTVRMASGHYKEDNYVDAVNYLLFAAELGTNKKKGEESNG